MSTHDYRRGIGGPTFSDAMLILAWFVFLLLVDAPHFRGIMLGAIPLVLVWGAVTLHFPSRVETGEEGISFWRYGRVHTFAWKDVTRVRVRRFLVRDRVLVRLEPSTPWRGRYWLVDTLEGFDPLVRELESRAAGSRGELLARD